MTQTVETGEVHFFYRAKLDAGKVAGPDDLQRLFLALVPDDRGLARLFVVGRKVLPEIRPGQSHPTERDWLLLIMVDEPARVGSALHPVQYETKGRGERKEPEAVPVGSGRYAIVPHGDATQLAYLLTAPERPGKAQEALGIRQEARYVLAVRNPSVRVEGFPEERPDYPEDLAESFADERWIDISDPRLLDYENAQLVLIGARAEIAPLDLDLGGRPDVFSTFGIDRGEWTDTPLKDGNFALPEGAPEPVAPKGDRSKGGRRGGAAARETDSAAGAAAALEGISFPSDRAGLVGTARDNDAPEEVIRLLEEIPDRKFSTMADVTEAIGEVR